MSVGTGYSGHGDGLNNPAKESEHNVGPLPKGQYTIGQAHTHVHLGPLSMELTPSGGQNMFGRSGFFIHGDNSKMDHSASDGCIILGPAIREKISTSGDHTLNVVGWVTSIVYLINYCLIQ